MQKITPCLWFDGKAEEAMNFYTSIFERSTIKDVMQQKGTILSATFELDGQEFMALNGGPMYKFTPAVSFFVKCETQDEVDRYWSKLQEGGGQPVQCGWLTDRFGVSWQIVPTILVELLQDKDPARANRAMQAMLKMVKLDIKALKDAAAAQD